MDNSLEPLVSIITPCYNSEKYISDTIRSVLKQEYRNWEMIIVDDASDDQSVDIINSIIDNEKRIKLFILSNNMGAGYCRNKGIDNAKGKYYAFLDSDDLWYPNKLIEQISFMEENNIIFSYTSYDFMSIVNKDQKNIIKAKSSIRYHDLLKTNHIGCLTVIYNSEIVNKDGVVHMSTIRCRQDLSLWLKILKKIDIAYGLDKILSTYRIRRESVSSNKIRVIYYQWKLYRDIEKISFLKSIYFLVFYLYFGLFKYLKKIM